MIFDRIVCGVDRSEESLEATRQAARLVSPDGRLLLVAVAEVADAVHGGWDAPTLAARIWMEAERALEQADGEIAPVRLAERRLVEGPAAATLLSEASRERATLVCVGTRRHGRASGILLGRVTTTLVHEAPCAVLVARRRADTARFPSSIVVGSDGSAEAAGAASAAASLRERFGASVRVLVATEGRPADVDAVLRARPDDAGRVDSDAVDALVSASNDVDLLVLGSRGLHGVKALGSVSERVAHEARCSVLIVRQP